ncbi:MAG: hypothetical protein JNK05_28165 [Myxococcales bacterium]|nr:hypothetical protein [Myxococcales bacterium]
MKTHTIARWLFALGALAGCKRGDRTRDPAQQAPIAAAPIAMQRPTPVAPVVAPTPVAEPTAVDPLWPRWLPPLQGVTRRMATASVFGGSIYANSLQVLVSTRQTFERQGYSLSQTTIRRQPWEESFVFTATRGDELVRVQLVSQPSRPLVTEVRATTGAVARTLMRRG